MAIHHLYLSFVDAVLVGAMKLDLWNITDTVGGRIQFGHDPRYSPYERLFFGQVHARADRCGQIKIVFVIDYKYLYHWLQMCS